jgi:hypothetical protein
VDPLKTKKQQRRSAVGFMLWSATILTAIAAAINLTSPDADGSDRLLGIGMLVGALTAAYWAGRWREL